MKHLLTALLSFCLGVAHAQKTEPKEVYVKLFSKEKIAGSELTYDVPILKPAVFHLDDQTIDSKNVEFVQNKHGFFANLSKIHGDKSERYAMRIKQGRANIYEEVSMEVYGKEILDIPSGSEEDMKRMDLIASGEGFEYYSVAEREVRKANVRNMRDDFADNEAALHEVNVIRKYQWLQVALIGAGAGFIAYDILKQASGPVRLNAPMVIGVVIGGSSYFLEGAKENARWLAIDEYNK
jgi:hypothetical protein